MGPTLPESKTSDGTSSSGGTVSDTHKRVAKFSRTLPADLLQDDYEYVMEEFEKWVESVFDGLVQEAENEGYEPEDEDM